MAIGGKRFWLGTWNCENQAPDPGMLGTWVVNPVTQAGNNGPDIIFLGFQEVVKHQGDFPYDRLGKDKAGRLGQHYSMPQHGHVDTTGFTKFKINSQALGMLVKNGQQVTNVQKGHFSHRGGKGGVYLTFTYEGQKFAVASCHLESKGARHQDNEINTILQQINAGGPYHTTFIMGDLNYRICGNQTVNPTEGKKLVDGGYIVHEYGGDGVIPKTMKGADMAHLILTPAGRSNLLRYDQLRESPLVAQHHFVFPVPQSAGNNPSFPTYKREYKNRGAVPAFMGARNVKNALAAYLLPAAQNMETAEERGFAYEIGWLDRVGYKSTHNPGAVVVEDTESLNLSDHSPVMMKYTFA